MFDWNKYSNNCNDHRYFCLCHISLSFAYAPRVNIEKESENEFSFLLVLLLSLLLWFRPVRESESSIISFLCPKLVRNGDVIHYESKYTTRLYREREGKKKRAYTTGHILYNIFFCWPHTLVVPLYYFKRSPYFHFLGSHGQRVFSGAPITKRRKKNARGFVPPLLLSPFSETSHAVSNGPLQLLMGPIISI